MSKTLEQKIDDLAEDFGALMYCLGYGIEISHGKRSIAKVPDALREKVMGDKVDEQSIDELGKSAESLRQEWLNMLNVYGAGHPAEILAMTKWSDADKKWICAVKSYIRQYGMRPKKTVTKEAKEETQFRCSHLNFDYLTFVVPKDSKNHRLTYEVEE